MAMYQDREGNGLQHVRFAQVTVELVQPHATRRHGDDQDRKGRPPRRLRTRKVLELLVGEVAAIQVS